MPSAHDNAELLDAWLREERQPFVGWDFSYLDGRMWDGGEPWDYSRRAAALMRGASSTLDMDTGGGEILMSLREFWRGKMTATEGYAPNFELARARLRPLGVRVVGWAASDDAPMPFADGEFDLVLNRHAAFNAREVARVLSDGGAFLTQQTSGMWAWDLQATFEASPQTPDVSLAKCAPLLEDAGLATADEREWEGRLKFADVGAVVYYLKAVPWEVPGFGVRTHFERLVALQERLDAEGELSFYAGKFLIEARKARKRDFQRDETGVRSERRP